MTGLLAGLAAAAALAAQPAPAPPLDDPEANLVEPVVVTARLPGPAWWKVSDADSTVYILGMFDGRLPPGMTWNTSVLERRLTGANVLIEQPVLQVGLNGLPGMLRTRSRLRSRTPLEETLPPPLRARFVAARTRAGQPASRYAGWEPLIAGERLVQDTRGEGWGEPHGDVTRLAKRLKVRGVRPSYDGRQVMSEAGALTPHVQQGCLEDALDDADQLASRGGTAAARAWAEGRVASAITAPRAFNRCFLMLGGGTAMWRRGTQDQSDMIAQALRRPGHSVALVGLRRLLAGGGVLQTLRAQGLAVAGPGEVAVEAP